MRLSTGEFLYVLLLPNSKDYTTVSKILEDQTTVQPGRMRRYRTTVDHLKALWPSAVLWQAKLAPAVIYQGTALTIISASYVISALRCSLFSLL